MKALPILMVVAVVIAMAYFAYQYYAPSLAPVVGQ